MNAIHGRNELSHTRYNTGQFERLRVTKHKTQFEYNKLLKNITPQFVDAIEKLRQSVLKLREDIMKFLEEDSLIEANFSKMLEDVDKRIAMKKHQRNQELLKNNSRRRKNAEKYHITTSQDSVKYLFTEPIRDCNHTGRRLPPRRNITPPSLVREISRINEKSLEKLREFYSRKQSNEEEAITQSENLKKQLLSDYPVLSSMAELMEDERGAVNPDPMMNIKIVFEELHDTRKRIAEWKKLYPRSTQVEKSLQECIVRRVVKRPKRLAVELEAKSKMKDAAVDEIPADITALPEESIDSHPTYRYSRKSLSNKNVDESSKIEGKEVVDSEKLPEHKVEDNKKPILKPHHRDEKQSILSPLSPIPSREASPSFEKDEVNNTVSNTIARKISKNELLGPDGEQRTITVTGPDKKVSIALTEELVETLGYIPEDEIDEKVWSEVQNCRYLRGHEPIDMMIPDGNLQDFVFHSNDDGDEEELDKEIE